MLGRLVDYTDAGDEVRVVEVLSPFGGTVEIVQVVAAPPFLDEDA